MGVAMTTGSFTDCADRTAYLLQVKQGVKVSTLFSIRLDRNNSGALKKIYQFHFHSRSPK